MSNEWNKAHPDVIDACRKRYLKTEKGRENSRKDSAITYAKMQRAVQKAGITWAQFKALPAIERKLLVTVANVPEVASVGFYSQEAQP